MGSNVGNSNPQQTLAASDFWNSQGSKTRNVFNNLLREQKYICKLTKYLEPQPVFIEESFTRSGWRLDKKDKWKVLLSIGMSQNMFLSGNLCVRSQEFVLYRNNSYNKFISTNIKTNKLTISDYGVKRFCVALYTVQCLRVNFNDHKLSAVSSWLPVHC